MKVSRVSLWTGCVLLGMVAGCSMVDRFMDKSDKPETYVRVWMDGMQARMGDVRCEVEGAVNTGPKVRYDLDADKMGRVSTVIINIFREFDGGWSTRADYVVTATDVNNPDAQMKPGETYDLGAPGATLQVIDRNNQIVDAVKLDPGVRYLMNFVVSADRSETVQVEFTTR